MTKNTRKTNYTRSIAIIVATLLVQTLILLKCSQNREIAEQPEKPEIVYYHDKIPAEEIQKTVAWLEEQKKEQFECDAKCTDAGDVAEIPETARDSIKPDEYMWLCKVTFAESLRTDEDEMTSIAATILNRVEADTELFPDDINSVIFQSGQFSSVKDEKVWWYREANVEVVVEDSDVTENVRKCVDRAINGEDPTEAVIEDGALFFYGVEYISEAELEKRKNIGAHIQYGGTIFYRDYIISNEEENDE